jgi:hypothetical protein
MLRKCLAAFGRSVLGAVACVVEVKEVVQPAFQCKHRIIPVQVELFIHGSTPRRFAKMFSMK